MGPEMLFFICFMGIFLIYILYILLDLRAQNKKIEQMSKRALLQDIIFAFKTYKPKK